MAIMDTTKRNALLALLRAQIGTPYVWGGNEPGKFDCSGLVQWVYGQFGIITGRTTWEQFKNGTAVDLSSIKPGDLIFFDTEDRGVPDNPTHVGVYTGDGKMVNAPREGDIVREVPMLSSSYWTSRIVGVRRFADYVGDSPEDKGTGDELVNLPELATNPLAYFITHPMDAQDVGLRVLVGGIGLLAIVIGLSALVKEPAIQAAKVITAVK